MKAYTEHNLNKDKGTLSNALIPFELSNNEK